MNRIGMICKKELICIRENKIFNLSTIFAPLFFLAAFTFMLSDGVSFPFDCQPDTEDSAFLQSIEDFRAPNGIGYIELIPTDGDLSQEASHDAIQVAEEPHEENGVLTGTIIHYVNDVNQNTTKNTKNRVDGALVHYLNQTRTSGNIAVEETTIYAEDIPWDAGFGTSVFVFGFMLAGLFFGALSIISEWENHTTTILKLSPYPVRYILIGKMFSNLLKCLASGFLFFLSYFLIFQTLPQHPWALLALAVLSYAAFSALGILLGLWFRTSVTSLVVCMGTAMTLWILGGGFGPLSFFGKLANAVASLNPITYAVDCIRWCYFDGAVSVAMYYVILLLFSVCCLILCAAVYTSWFKRKEGRTA